MIKLKLLGITIIIAILLALIVALFKMLFTVLTIFIGYMWATIIYPVFGLAMIYYLVYRVDKAINQF